MEEVQRARQTADTNRKNRKKEWNAKQWAKLKDKMQTYEQHFGEVADG